MYTNTDSWQYVLQLRFHLGHALVLSCSLSAIGMAFFITGMLVVASAISIWGSRVGQNLIGHFSAIWGRCLLQ